MTKIIRTKSKATGGITAAEKKLMDEHSQLWIKRAMRTDPIDPDKIIPTIESLYAVAGLKKPRVIIVPSPLVMAFAYGAAAAIWHGRKSGKASATRNATDNATASATYNATRSATRSATYNATDNATYNATASATYNATRNATYNATRSATDNATYNATRSATRSATYNATDNATYNATASATANAIASATRNATDSATASATDNATFNATASATFNATHSATYSATDSATFNATRNATYNATYSATRSATYNATDNATYNATLSATDNATRNATYNATYNATRSATDNATQGAAITCKDLAGELGLACANRWGNNYQGGNMWAGYDCYLTACRDILGLELREHTAYACWEQAAIHGGFRVMHEEFCLVSDFPEIILKDEQNRPHCEIGPSHRWRDGWSLYHWHGIAVPAHWIEQRATLDPAEVMKEKNVELRAAGAAIIGWPRMIKHLKRKIIDGDPNTDIGALIELTLPGLREPGRFLQAVCPRNGTIVEGVPYISDIDNKPINTVIAAQAWRDGLPASEYQHPIFRT